MQKSQIIGFTAILLLAMGSIGMLYKTTAQSIPALNAAVSIQPLGGIVREVGGSQVAISVLLPEGIEPHAFTLTPAVINAATAADLLVLTGHFEWEEDLANQTGKPFISLADYQTFGLELLSLPENGNNLHGYWLLPQNAIAIANATRSIYSVLNATHIQYWQDRFHEFLLKIGELEAFIAEQLLNHDLFNKRVIITFPAEAYVAEALGLEVRGLLMEGESIFISGPKLVAIEQALRNGSIDLILASDVAQLQAAGEFAQQLSTDSGVPLVWIRSVFSLLSDYLGIMAYNTGVVITGISGGIPPAIDFLTISMPVIIIAGVLGVIAIIQLLLLVRLTRTKD